MCIFCKIVNGEIPCYKIYEDQDTLAFLDIAHDIDGHTLVIPKKHVENILDCDLKTLTKVAKTVKKVSRYYVNKKHFDGVNTFNCNNAAAEQSVMHYHVHILPRRKDDNQQVCPELNCAKKSLEETQKKLKMK